MDWAQDPSLLDAGWVAAAFAAWYGLFNVMLLVTRPAYPTGADATPDLGDESPAVVSLLANRWEPTEDLAESTLLDLAARRHLELRQPADDPRQTTIHIADTAPDDLLPYEQQVLERIKLLAHDGVVPVTALTFRDPSAAESWNKSLNRKVVDHARRLGLSRKRFNKTVTTVLSAAAFGVAVLAFWAVVHFYILHPDSEDGSSPGIFIGLFAGAIVFFSLSGFAAAFPGDRDTPLGRTVAARWLGVRQWLRAHETFADLPPAAVAVWDRYLPYGAALGVTRVASAVLDLGMGNRNLVWSSFGGTWHRVKVRYPSMWRRYGRTGLSLIRTSIFALAVGYVLLRYRHGPRAFINEMFPEAEWERWFDLGEQLAYALGVLLLILYGYRLVRTVVDFATQRTITGQVLWIEAWPPLEGRHWLAVDAGTGDRTTAWALPQSGLCTVGDTVQMRVRPWSRRVIDVKVVEVGAESRAAMAAAEAAAAAAREREVLAAKESGVLPAAQLLTSAQVTEAAGIAVTEPEVIPLPGGFAVATFVTADRRKPVLMLQVTSNKMMSWAWSLNAKGTPVPGVGDGAFVDGDRAAVRVGNTFAILTLIGPGRGRSAAFQALLPALASNLRPGDAKDSVQ